MFCGTIRIGEFANLGYSERSYLKNKDERAKRDNSGMKNTCLSYKGNRFDL